MTVDSIQKSKDPFSGSVSKNREMMYRVVFGTLMMSTALMPHAVTAQSRTATQCVRFTPHPDPSTETHIGWIENACDNVVISVVVDLGVHADGTPKSEPWCTVSGDFILPGGATMLAPNENIGVGWGMFGKAKSLNWAACTAEKPKNNSLAVFHEWPGFRFDSRCNYECQ